MNRVRFVAEVDDGLFTMTELCARYGISRKTGYKWCARAGDLRDRPRRPVTCPTAIPRDVVALIRALRHAHPTWGPRKLRILLQRRGVRRVPARSTIALILRREGLSRRGRRRPRAHPGPRPQTVMTTPNAVWTADFKGHFRTHDGAWCYPLTIIDGFSRFLVACHALAAPGTSAARPVFERAFRRYGLPAVLRTDNGEPFAGPTTIGRLSRLAVWWLRLGIQVERIAPGCPSQNGRHERFHRTLLADTLQPQPAMTRQAQHARFRAYRQIYNHVRPHQALHDRTPASLYTASARPWPPRLPPLEYSAAHLVRRVGPSGSFNWRSQRIPLSHVLAGEDIGLLAVGDGQWALYFGSLRLGRLDERTRRIETTD